MVGGGERIIYYIFGNYLGNILVSCFQFTEARKDTLLICYQANNAVSVSTDHCVLPDSASSVQSQDRLSMLLVAQMPNRQGHCEVEQCLL